VVSPGVDVRLHGNTSGGSGTYTTHSWTGPGATYLSATNVEDPIFNSDTPGTYDLTYTVTDSNGCVASDDIQVEVKAPSPPSPPPPPPPYVGAVGGQVYPVNRLAMLAPWIGLAMLLIGSITWLTLRCRGAQS